MNNNKTKMHSFAKGAVILTFGMLTVKILGAAFKIPLMSVLGGEGSGYFTGAYNLYNPIYALATAGLPIAVSKVVSENYALGKFRDIRKLRKISMPIFLITGTIGFILIIFGAFVYANFAKAPGAIYSIFMLAPTLFFSCLMSTYRGYYEGLRNMTPTAVSEVIESFGKVIFGLSFAHFTIWSGQNEFNNYGTIFGKLCLNLIEAEGRLLQFASASAVAGIAISAMLGFFYMFLRYKLKGDDLNELSILKSPEAQSSKKLLKDLIKVAAPVGLGAIVMNLAGVIDSVLIQRRLAHAAVFSLSRLASVYGNLLPEDVITRGNIHIFLAGCFGFTTTITMFLPTISQGIAISTLPTITAAWALKKEMKKNVEKIIKFTSIISIPMGFGLSALALPVMDLVYNTFRSGMQASEVKIGAGIMAISGIAAVFTALSTPVCSMLQAIGRADLPVKIISIGVVIKIILNYILVGIPEINIQGAGIGTLACYIVVFASSIVFLCKITKIKLDFVSTFLKPLISGLICAASAYIFYKIFSIMFNSKISTILSIIASAIIYFVSIFLFRTFDISELESFPIVSKFAKFFKKIKNINS
ncbi:MAG: polysaccharide biosynthesis protein [Oscillospiraceae bacterium]|jgi:stage V sporulation protein B|nr:polysaccharide biosynthesis protein [Oscillospiraceae bacterium]